MSHTPGPWNVWGIPGEIDLAVGPAEGGLAVAQVVTTNAHGFATERTTTTGAANAALIASAPELVEELRKLVLRCDTTALADGSSIDTMAAHALLDRIFGSDW